METFRLSIEDCHFALEQLGIALRRDLLKIGALHLAFGLSVALIVYFATPYDLRLAMYLGLACVVFSLVPVLLHLRGRFVRLYREVGNIESDVAAGKIVHNTDIGLPARKAPKSSDAV